MNKEPELEQDEKLKKKVNKISFISISGIVQFLILSLIAMLFYPRGTREDELFEEYSFSFNKFSDLGMWETFSGESNLISFLIFNIGLIILGLSLIPYVVFSANYFRSQKMPRHWVYVGEITGIIASLAFVGVGLTPRDLLQDLHKIAEYSAFLTIFIMSLMYMLFIYKVSYYHNKYAIIYALCVVCQFLYLFIVLDIIPVTLEIDCISQKLIVYLQLIVFLIQSIGILHLDKDLN
ncbi:hypothetical protein DSAG12_02876 [Promethearchaeum syntrophicum]|uniref:Frag1/DRAM/Sfk1 family protein n=1 Tax=Promethearchaeum syntrophicum TaxID=2594042 RepID=A0A5B9DD36_9ARCH|nr:hypothetical protein [Candidatus Prometheoarchaeum syntrophicum]QEE17044.1 hypothetical protein DSAG12_02876 [Candidatus Prometheoarchaeum syntrophicum]